MKKQIVLSLSILVLALSSDLFAVKLAGYKPAQEDLPRNQPPASTGIPASTVTSASASEVPASSAMIAAQGLSLHDVAEALVRLGADASKATEQGADRAEAYIKGQTASGSQASSSKMGRLGNRK